MHKSLSIALAVLLTGCLTKVPDMTPDEMKRIEQFTTRPMTWCIGRYLIDLPAAFVMNSESKGAEVDGVKIVEVKPMSKGQFRNALADREAELRKEETYLEGRRVLLKGIESQSVIALGKVFNRAESISTVNTPMRVLELLAWKDGFLIAMRIKATDGTDMRLDPSVIGTPFEASERRIVSEGQSKKDTPVKLAHLLDVYQRVRGRPNEQIPTEQGLCISNGFVAGPAIEKEIVGYLFDLKDSPDVYFSFTEDGDLHEETTLLQRSAQVEKEMALSGTKTVRKGVRDLGQLSYEEWLMRGPTPDRVPGTMFSLLGNEVAKGADKPFVKLTMRNGFRVVRPSNLSDSQKEKLGLYKSLERATLTESEALAIWDKVSATLRPRPGAF